MSSTNEYLTVPNMKKCERIFLEYMRDKHSMDLASDASVRKTLFKIMDDIANKRCEQGDLKQLNNLTMNIARDVYIVKRQSKSSTNSSNYANSTNMNNHVVQFDLLKRESTTQSNNNRPPPQQILMGRPMVTCNATQGDVNKNMERLMSERDLHSNTNTGKLPNNNEFQDTPFDTDDFARRLAEIEQLRGDSKDRFAEVLPVHVEDTDNQEMYRATLDDVGRFNAFNNDKKEGGDQSTTLIEAPVPRHTITKYLTLAGFDRDFSRDKMRYSYSINVSNDMQTSLKNVVEMSVTSVIIPMDVNPLNRLANVLGTLKNHNELTFAYPYVTLNIDNLNNSDGTNDAVRKAFVVLKYDVSYRGPNGRGYVSLIPMSTDAAKVFQQAQTLMVLKMTLMKPNGTIYANTQDDYTIDHLEYEAFNRMYVKVITNKYFDKGEFFAGDALNFRGFSVKNINNNTTRSLENFMNRPEGHEIVEIGQPNDAGYYKTFYILAPGVLDQAIGRVALDDEVIAFITESNISDGFAGYIMNASLQPVISMTAKMTI